MIFPAALLCLAIGADSFTVAPHRHAVGLRIPRRSASTPRLFASQLKAANANANTTADPDDFYMQYSEFSHQHLPEHDKAIHSPMLTALDTDVTEVFARKYDAIASKEIESANEKEEEGLSDVWKARLLLLAAAALYGTNFSLVKILGDTMPVGISSTLRFGMASLATAPWLLLNWKKNESLHALWLGLEVGMWASIGYVAQAVGLETTPASESAFICSLAVVTVPLLDFATGKRLKTREWVGAFAAVIGVALLELGGGDLARGLSFGDVCSLIQPLAFGMGFWRMERAMQKYPEQASRATAAQLLAVFMASAAYGVWSLDMNTIATDFPWQEWVSSPMIWLSLFWTGVVTTAATVFMETLALKSLSAAETTLIFSTEPLWGTAFAAAVMGEKLGWDAALGAVLILSGCVYSNLGVSGIQAMFRQSNDAKNEKPTSSLPRTRVRKQPSMRDLPAHLNKQWLWFSSSATAVAASFGIVIQETALPEVAKEVEQVAENIVTTASDKLPF